MRHFKHVCASVMRILRFKASPKIVVLALATASLIPLNAFASGNAAMLGSSCSIELQSVADSAITGKIRSSLVCIQSSSGLIWENPNKVIADAHLNSILLKCGTQIHPISVNKVNRQLLTAYQFAESKYISAQLHLKLVSYVTNWGFFNLNAKYYGRIGMCSNGVGSLISYVGPDSRIPTSSNLLWESFVNCKIGPQTAALEFVFARVDNLWRFVAMGPINAQPVYL